MLDRYLNEIYFTDFILNLNAFNEIYSHIKYLRHALITSVVAIKLIQVVTT